MKFTRSNYRSLMMAAGAAVSLSAAVPVWAQVGSASLSGLVQDSSGALIPDAAVTLHNLATGADRKVTSNGSGSFTFSALPSGNYSVTLARDGFQSYTRTPVHLDPGDNKSLVDLRWRSVMWPRR